MTNSPTANMITSRAHGPGAIESRPTQAARPKIPPTNRRGTLTRVARPATTPPATIIEIVCAASSGPAHAGLAPSSVTRNGMNRTLMAPDRRAS